MSARVRNATAPLFAALGDETRLSLVRSLCTGPRSISRLTEGTRLTRQGITKHLRVLEGAGLVHSIQRGRETVFELDGARLLDARRYLDAVAQQWEAALQRLKALVEE